MELSLFLKACRVGQTDTEAGIFHEVLNIDTDSSLVFMVFDNG